MEDINRKRARSKSVSEERPKEGGYREVSKAAVRKEGDVKEAMGPSVSMTVVGEQVEFTQHFHF